MKTRKMPASPSGKPAPQRIAKGNQEGDGHTVALSLLLIVTVLLVTACSAATSTPTATATATISPPTATETATATATATPPPTATAVPPPTPALRPRPSPSEPLTITVTQDIPYMQPAVGAIVIQELDIYAPELEGPWPVVVLAHGMSQDKGDMVGVAQAMAERGMVVFAIDWPVQSGSGATAHGGRGYREMDEAMLCALRYARGRAAEHGGDPYRLTLMGFSAGAAVGYRTAMASDELDILWADLEATSGEPVRQIACLEEGSAQVSAFIGVGGFYTPNEWMLEANPDLRPLFYLLGNPELQIHLLHGRSDSTTPYNASVQLAERLTAADYAAQVTLFDGGHTIPTDLAADAILDLYYGVED